MNTLILWGWPAAVQTTSKTKHHFHLGEHLYLKNRESRVTKCSDTPQSCARVLLPMLQANYKLLLLTQAERTVICNPCMQMTCASSEYSPAHLKELCILHKVYSSLDRITAEFLQFKQEHIDILDFVDAQMLKTYEFAFFCCFFELKTGPFLKIHKFNRSIFLKTVNEVNQKARLKDIKTESNFVCSLYSIIHDLPCWKQ